KGCGLWPRYLEGQRSVPVHQLRRQVSRRRHLRPAVRRTEPAQGGGLCASHGGRLLRAGRSHGAGHHRGIRYRHHPRHHQLRLPRRGPPLSGREADLQPRGRDHAVPDRALRFLRPVRAGQSRRAGRVQGRDRQVLVRHRPGGESGGHPCLARGGAHQPDRVRHRLSLSHADRARAGAGSGQGVRRARTGRNLPGQPDPRPSGAAGMTGGPNREKRGAKFAHHEFGMGQMTKVGKLGLAGGVCAIALASAFAAPAAQKGVMLMNRIGPSKLELYVANADGTGEHRLLPNSTNLDYDASFSPDGKWIVFTSEGGGAGQGQADIWRVHPDGSGLERLTSDPSLEDAGVLSPDGTKLAYVSTKGGARTTNIWVLDLKTRKARNLTWDGK